MLQIKISNIIKIVHLHSLALKFKILKVLMVSFTLIVKQEYDQSWFSCGKPSTSLA